MILLELLLGLLDRGARRDDVSDSLAANGMSQRVGRTVRLSAFLGAVTGQLAAFTEARH